jgi:hypothetical protein
MHRRSGVQLEILSQHPLEATRRLRHLETSLVIRHPRLLEVLRLVGANSSRLVSEAVAIQALVAEEVRAARHHANFLRKGAASLGTIVSSLMILVLAAEAILPLVAEEASDRPTPISAATRRLDDLVDEHESWMVSGVDLLSVFEYLKRRSSHEGHRHNRSKTINSHYLLAIEVSFLNG